MAVIDEVYALAAPYWQTRSNEIHVPEAYDLAKRLLAEIPEADPAIVLPAILLHDVGYARVPEEDQLKGLAGAPSGWEPDITRRHEVEGARLAGEILAEVGYDAERTRRIQAIVDGHDSRPEALDLDDAVVKDADKLWRFTENGVRIAHAWVGRTPEEFVDFLETRIEGWFFTDAAKALARTTLTASRAAIARDRA
ncbi:MAG: Metal-dependent phosphohydrolase, HD subdomain [uncultured Thermoleophilia bacterium]|uniref:Metal-dependent phosphohydrolase, HD subdomain n=1 Tax=uncultured Thermoleophilia bacterium TaxID=1497501 RepID=A0A6J4TFW2_9ACTN|nr:MAG: Metal-dependent phosphohydrolase, HD subdomain [uncultured Thermoleophilia bacterium]